MRCWEFMHCGRELGGARAHELGVCPACTQGGGRACWLIAGTFCGGAPEGRFAEKMASCIECSYFRSLPFEHKVAMWKQFGSRYSSPRREERPR